MSWIDLGLRLATITVARLRCHLPERVRSADAQSTVEYALVGALVVLAAAGALTILGSELTSIFSNISNTLKTASVGH